MASYPNPFKVAHAGDGRVVILNPPTPDEAGVQPAIPGDDALNLAANILAIVDPTFEKAALLVKTIRGK